MSEAEIERLRRRQAELEAELAPLRVGTGTSEDAHGRRHRSIFESTVDFAIVATDRSGRVTDWNTGAEHIFGWSAEEMRGELADRLFTPEDRGRDRPVSRCGVPWRPGAPTTSVRGQLGGKVSLAWVASGLVCEIKVPLKPGWEPPGTASASVAK
jgi:PAS domain-containing protein